MNNHYRYSTNSSTPPIIRDSEKPYLKQTPNIHIGYKTQYWVNSKREEHKPNNFEPNMLCLNFIKLEAQPS